MIVRRTPSLRHGMILLTAIALVVAACAGHDPDDSVGADPADRRGIVGAAEAAECPLEALEQAEERVDITLWHGLVGLSATTLEKFAEEYNASQDRVQVSVDPQGDYEELFAKFTIASRANDDTSLPDILLAQDTDTQYLVDSGTVVAADHCIAADDDAQELYDTLAESVRATYTVEGLLWPAAFGVATPVLYYNRAHLQQAGLDPDDPPADLAELRSTAEAIKAVRPEGRPVAFRAHSWWIENLATRQQDELVDNDNGRSGLARRSGLLNDTVVEVVQWMADMVDDGLMTVFAHSQVSEPPLAVIRPDADNASMLIETSSAATTLDALLGGGLEGEDLGAPEVGEVEPIDIGVSGLPGPRGASSAGSGQVAGNAWYLVDGPEPEKIAAAWDFMRWVTQTPQQVEWTMQGSYLPVWQGAIDDPDLRRYFTDSRPGRWLEVARSSLETIDPRFPGPLIGPYTELREANRNALERILIDDRPVRAELGLADAAFQSALDDYARDIGGG